jgi:hypothetical protein
VSFHKAGLAATLSIFFNPGGFGSLSISGTQKWKVAPWPGVLEASIAPP